MDVETEEKSRCEAQMEEQETPILEPSEDDENVAKESVISELGSERTDDDDTEEYEEKNDKSKEYSKSDIETDYSGSLSEEVSAEIAEESLQEVVTKQENEMPIAAKPVKSIISVTEVNCAVDEVVFTVGQDTIDATKIEKPEDNQNIVKRVAPENVNKDNDSTSKSDSLIEGDDQGVSECSKEDSVPIIDSMGGAESIPTVPDNENEETLLANQSIPHLKKEVMEVNIETEDKPTAKSGRGRKKDPLKENTKKSIRTLDMSGTSMASSTAEIPMLEPMEPAMQPADPIRQQKEPSPYDFEEDVESSWKPDITKKWEPTTSSTSDLAETVTPCDQKTPKVAGLELVGDEEKERKKVKKKAKKKPISPEFVEEIKTDEASSAPEEPSVKTVGKDGGDDLPASDMEVVSEKIGPRKKGRKKKECGADAKKEVIDQYENTVNSVVEAVKCSLQEPDSDQEQRPPVKRRRPKRVSESDSKDVAKSAKFMRKFGARKTTSAEGLEVDTPDEIPKASVAPEVSSAPALPTQGEDEALPSKKASSREPSFCESQGFEPRQDPQDGNAAFDNTPPTTPEHDDGSNSGSLQQEDKGESSSHNQHHAAPSILEPSHQKESPKVVCSSSSATSSLALSASSTTNVTSHVQTSTKSSSESPSDNDVISTASTDNLDSGATNQQSESSEPDQDTQDAPSGTGRKRKQPEGPSLTITAQPKKKKRVHGTRSRTARKSPKCKLNLLQYGESGMKHNCFVAPSYYFLHK